MKIAVIGAGISGLVTIHHALDLGLEVTAFDKQDDIGGIWQYSEDIETEVPHSAVYRNLRSNLPKELMEFPDFKHKPSEV